ncbi:glycosyltransferase family 4 protein [Costertonia aggregata]|uniref:Glycosyltransferase family 4 protein n=1 Tax=Costertonia aggregata TaxID=343403 RepID=A0A7H9AM91_9FLAO|nr:glycosyltransferase family 4 protein [Costertonia aggregata]QLG44572.1 glycosyltransferase family 4 protein [Costertonia aggregata]
MKKILFILHYPPPIHGAAMVGKHIRDSELINASFDCTYINLSTSASVTEIGKGGIKKIIRYLNILYFTIKNVLQYRPNLIYITISATGAGFYKDALIALIVKLMRVKVVYHFHNKGIDKHQDKWLDNILNKLIFKNVEVILLSEHLYYDISKYVSKANVHYCPNGIPENRKQNSGSIEKGNSENVMVLFLSNLLISKGIYTLLDACRLLKDKNLPFQCILAGGEGDIDTATLAKRISLLEIDDKVTYVGKKYGNDKENEYSKADIFVFPSYDETFGLVNLEAMQFNLPVISTNEGGIPDVVLDNVTGFLVPSHDSKALAEKLEILIVNPVLRKKMGDNGRKRYEENFTLKIFESNFHNIVDKLVS